MLDGNNFSPRIVGVFEPRNYKRRVENELASLIELSQDDALELKIIQKVEKTEEN